MSHRRLVAIAVLMSLLGAHRACAQPAAGAAPAVPTTGPAAKTDLLKHIQVDVKNKAVHIECEVCKADYGLEFFCVSSGGNEYEAVLSSKAKPSGLHLALLMIGLQAGEPVKYVESANRWLPPHGPPLQISCQFDKGGKSYDIPAYRLMRNNKTKKEVPAMTWIFTGSKIMEDGQYGADPAGYLVSVLNNELSVIDISVLAGRALETREWEPNADLLPAPGSKITLTFEPAGKVVDPTFENPAAIAPGGAPAEKSDAPRKDPLGKDPRVSADPLSGNAFASRLGAAEKSGAALVKVTMDAVGKAALNGEAVTLPELTEKLKALQATGKAQAVWVVYEPTSNYDEAMKVIQAVGAAGVELAPENVGSAAPDPTDSRAEIAAEEAKVKLLKARWLKAVAPHQQAIREAAQAHYEVIETLRREQNRLIDEADRIQRVIDELTKDYDNMTTPHPEANPVAPKDGGK